MLAILAGDAGRIRSAKRLVAEFRSGRCVCMSSSVLIGRLLQHQQGRDVAELGSKIRRENAIGGPPLTGCPNLTTASRRFAPDFTTESTEIKETDRNEGRVRTRIRNPLLPASVASVVKLRIAPAVAGRHYVFTKLRKPLAFCGVICVHVDVRLQRTRPDRTAATSALTMTCR
jgi:hypothetical protein